MEVVRINGRDIPAGQPSAVVALGFFDGVHRGHAALLARARAEASARGVLAAVFAFVEDGEIKAGVPRLTTEEERLSLFAAAGIDRVYLFDFAALRDLSPAAFAEGILINGLSCVAAVCGFNFRFGAAGAGDASTLATLFAAHALPVAILPPYELEGAPVSSTVIRAALEAGECERVTALLGRPYTLAGTVAHGRALGRQMGYPTANFALTSGHVVPAWGVYAVTCVVEDGPPVQGVANLGVRPTVADGDAAPNCEVHLFGEVGDLYGKRLTVSFLRRLRGEKKFESVAALQRRIAADIAQAKEFFING